MASVLRSAELLLAPEMVLDILRTYTLFSRRSSTQGGYVMKVIPRYPQVEAVDSIVERVRDTAKRQGLVWHHQGSGKTLLMAFAAAKLRQQLDLDAPTILVVLDRLDLIEQVQGEFASVGIPGLKVGETKDQLRRLLSEDARGVIVTTIFRFEDAGLLNDRPNIVVMVDEAHRTQEGRLGLDMREALPNAKFIGLTGTPISTDDRNTWATFGDPDDPDGVLNHYSVERSIADGATLADPRRDPPRRLPHRPRRPRPGLRRAGRGRGPRRARDRHRRQAGLAGRSDHEDPGPHRGGVRRHRRALPVQGRAARAQGAGRGVRPGAVRRLPRRDQRAARTRRGGHGGDDHRQGRSDRVGRVGPRP